MTSTAQAPVLHINDDDCRRLIGVFEVVGRRWSGGILLALGRGADRFSQIEQAVEGISARMLTARLRELEAAELVERTVLPTTPVSVRYALTARGRELLLSMQPMAQFAMKWEVADSAHVDR